MKGPVGDDADARVPQLDQVLNGHVRGLDVVHIDEGDVRVAQLAQQDDGEAFLVQRAQRVVVGARAREDDAVGALFQGQRRVPVVIGMGDRLEENAVAVFLGHAVDAQEHLRQEGVGKDLLGRLAEDEAEGHGAAADKAAGRGVRVVIELARGLQDAASGFGGDARVGHVVQHEGDRGAGHARQPGHVLTGHPLALGGHESLPAYLCGTLTLLTRVTDTC